MFKSVLIANRGEIAVRIIRTCKLLDIGTVAIYSAADADALHVKLADRAVRIGSADPGDSYLNIEKIIRTAVETGVDAVHPGYGFVSENWNLAAGLEDAGIAFVGPKSRTLTIAGNKIDCKRIAKRAGVPVTEGSGSVIFDPEEARQTARKMGYPVLLKSAFGGGGRGIREAANDGELLENFRTASSETRRSLGRVGLFIEKLIKPARHIEVQILSDGKGKTIQLGERECSIQRRRQKLVEMAPAPGLTDDDRKRVGNYAVSLINALDFKNAGTVEFLMDSERNFYFIEMNSRLQVEHGVTEVVAGVDLVKEQLEIAAGEGIDYSQKDVVLSGAAIECRINAEDPCAGFYPSAGRIEQLFFPGGADVRIDTALYPGYEVPEYYDSLIAKLITSGRSLEEARRRMVLALDELRIDGLKTTIPLHKLLMANPQFASWNLDTSFMERHRIVESLVEKIAEERAALAEKGSVLAATLLELNASGRPLTIQQGTHHARDTEPEATRFYDAV